MIVGAELVAGRGKAAPKPAALHERLIRLWAGPQGAPKAAAASGDKTTVSHDTGKPLVTFPIPGAPGAIAKVTLSAQNMAERVEVRRLYAGTLVEKRNGVIIRDLTTTETETGNVYVVMPVPASVRNAAATQR